MLTRSTREHTEPVRDPRLASVLDAAAAPAEPGPLPGEEAALAAFRASSARADGWRTRMHTTPIKALGVAAASAGLLLTGGLAAANAGMLPGAAQDKAQEMLDSVGVQVPGANEHSAGHADTHGKSDEAPPTTDGADSASTLPDAAGFGQMISELARTTEAEGVEKGKTISEAAKANGEAHQNEHAQAPEQSAASADHAQTPDAGKPVEGDAGQSGDKAPVVTPNGGGTGTANDATTDHGGSASTDGAGTAAERSGDRSTLGSGNRP